MARKAPRRTAERILETSLALFNRFGEPNVSTAAISAELRISPGNLYYHFPSKDTLINRLFAQYASELTQLLDASADIRDVEDAWFFLHTLFELVWAYRFLYRDLNNLLSRNRTLEKEFPLLLAHKKQALRTLIDHLSPRKPSHAGKAADGATREDRERDHDAVATSMAVLLTYWLSYEYVLQPRTAMEPENAENAPLHGAYYVMHALLPYLGDEARTHLRGLLRAYRPDAVAPSAPG